MFTLTMIAHHAKPQEFVDGVVLVGHRFGFAPELFRRVDVALVLSLQIVDYWGGGTRERDGDSREQATLRKRESVMAKECHLCAD